MLKKFFFRAFLVLLLVVVVFAGVVAMQPSEFHIERTAVIPAPARSGCRTATCSTAARRSPSGGTVRCGRSPARPRVRSDGASSVRYGGREHVTPGA